MAKRGERDIYETSRGATRSGWLRIENERGCARLYQRSPYRPGNQLSSPFSAASMARAALMTPM